MAKKASRCPVTRGEVDLSKYEELDEEWRSLGLAAPARRALVDAGIFTFKDLTTFRETEIAELHGMGPKALAKLKDVMKQRSLSFKP